MTGEEIVNILKSWSNPTNVAGMARYGIRPAYALGIKVSKLRELAKQIGKDHKLAQDLWNTGIHEARLLASIIAIPARLSERQMESWADDFDSWDICDQCCNNLFRKTEFAHRKAIEWSKRVEEYVKRAGFTLMASLAVHDKKSTDDVFDGYLPLIKIESVDERNYVKKAVNWALRQIGKRNRHLNRLAIYTAQDLKTLDSKSARWIADNALRELTGDKVQNRLEQKEEKNR